MGNGDRLLQGGEHVQLQNPRQFAGGVENARIFPADQHQPATIAQRGQMANDFNAIHARHLEIAEQQRDRGQMIGNGGQCGAGIGLAVNPCHTK